MSRSEIHIPMQSPTSTDFTCLPPDIITAIASTSAHIWHTLACVNNACSGILSRKAYVLQFTTTDVVTKLYTVGHYQEVFEILDPGRTWIKLLDGVPHSEDGADTWFVEAGTRYSLNLPSGVNQSAFDTQLSGVYRRGKLVRPSGAFAFTPISPVIWSESVR